MNITHIYYSSRAKRRHNIGLTCKNGRVIRAWRGLCVKRRSDRTNRDKVFIRL